MDEATWLTSTDPAAMLGYLLGSDWADTSHEWNRHPTATDRKLRLFVAAVERAWWKTPDRAMKTDLLRLEKIADGKYPPKPLLLAFSLTGDAVEDAMECVRIYNLNRDKLRWANLLRDIFGNPFRPVRVCLTPQECYYANRCENERDCPIESLECWMAWNDGTVRRLAQSIYSERQFENLPILADALEEAGCCNQDILAHCRGDFLNAAGERVVGANRHLPHVRGCWVIDLLLGKE